MYLEQELLLKLYLKWLVTLALLVPQTAWAGPVDSRSTRTSNPQVQAAIIPIANSQDFIAIAPVSQDHEANLIRSLIERTPDTTVLAISGTMDPSVHGIGSERNFKDIHIVQASRPEDIPAIDSLPKSLRQKLQNKIREIKGRLSVDKVGLMLAYVSAAASSGATFYATGNYLSAGGMLGVLVAFNSYQYFFKAQWGKFKHLGHAGVVGLAEFVSRMTGYEVSRTEKEKIGMYGEFNSAWIANSTVTGVVLTLATGWNDVTMQLPLQALVAGFVANPDVWDYSVRRIGDNINYSTDALLKRFIAFRLGVTAILDVATNLHLIQSTELFMGILTMSGLMWWLAGDKVERELLGRFSNKENRRALVICKRFLKRGRLGI